MRERRRHAEHQSGDSPLFLRRVGDLDRKPASHACSLFFRSAGARQGFLGGGTSHWPLGPVFRGLSEDGESGRRGGLTDEAVGIASALPGVPQHSGHPLEKLPADDAVRLDERPKVPEGDASAEHVGRGRNRRHAGTFVD
jgi:hypothetical protein